MKKMLCSLFLCFSMVLSLSAQPSDEKDQPRLKDRTPASAGKFFLAPGMGLDFGVLGGKFQYLPEKHIALFAGVGYNLISVGLNAGVIVKILPAKRATPTLTCMYGYNGGIAIDGISLNRYTKVSYGITFGAGVEIRTRDRGDHVSINLFVPVRSESFIKEYKKLLQNPEINWQSELLPVAFSVGYNFMLKL